LVFSDTSASSLSRNGNFKLGTVKEQLVKRMMLVKERGFSVFCVKLKKLIMGIY